MKAIHGALREKGSPFRTTHWTVVLHAAQSQSPETGQAALASFCQDYWPPLYTFLRRRGYAPTDAQDLVQGFFEHLLTENTLSRAQRDRGRLRTFLLNSLEYFMANDLARGRTLKRGGEWKFVSLDDPTIEARAARISAGENGLTGSYDRLWASALMEHAWRNLETALNAEGKTQWFQAIKPLLVGGGETPPPSETVAARLEMSVENLRTTLHRLRRRFRETLRAEVARTVSTSKEIDEEMDYIYHLLKA